MNMRVLLVCLLLFLFRNSGFAGDIGPQIVWPKDMEASQKPLSFYLEHNLIVSYGESSEEGGVVPLKFDWQKIQSLHPQVRQLGHDWTNFYVVEYLPSDLLEKGYVIPKALLLLRKVESNLYSPVVSCQQHYAIDRYWIDSSKKFEKSPYLALFVQGNGQGETARQRYLRRKNDSMELESFNIFWGDDKEIWNELTKLGWEPWHRGFDKSVDEQLLSQHIYHPEKGHSWLTIKYKLKDSLLVPHDWKITDEPFWSPRFSSPFESMDK